MDVLPRVSALVERVNDLFSSSSGVADLLTPVPQLLVMRKSNTSTLEATFYEPVVCLILQGEKETMVGDKALRFGAGESLIVSHELPVSSRITVASREHPYLALIFRLDMAILRSLYEQVAGLEMASKGVASMQASMADEVLLDALHRYLALSDTPLEEKVLGPLMRKELHFRLLMSEHGGMLRELLRYDSHASKIARAIGQIRKEFRTPLVVPALARSVGMSASSFHSHFKSITETTPLQYQKSLRLLEARRLLFEGEHSVSTAAFEVGYESPTQFSREFSRKFGISPRNAIQEARQLSG